MQTQGGWMERMPSMLLLPPLLLWRRPDQSSQLSRRNSLLDDASITP